MSRRLVARLVASALAATTLANVTNASAQRVRRRFDPDDLEIDPPGVMHGDFAFGVMRGEVAGRWLVPDFDLDLSIAPKVEIGVDGAWAIEGTPTSRYSLDHRSPDNLWLNSKLNLWERKADADRTGWAVGAQLGPRVAFAPGVRGTGFQAVGLVARHLYQTKMVLNVGGMVDPGSEVSRGRPVAFLSGIDLSVDLDADGTWSIMGDLSGAFFFGPDKHQLATTFGPVLAVAPWLDVSVNALVGILAGGNQYGGFLQISPKVPVF